jgi:hypothetical protein
MGKFIVYVETPTFGEGNAVIYEQKRFVVVDMSKERAVEILRRQYPNGIITTGTE